MLSSQKIKTRDVIAAAVFVDVCVRMLLQNYGDAHHQIGKLWFAIHQFLTLNWLFAKIKPGAAMIHFGKKAPGCR